MSEHNRRSESRRRSRSADRRKPRSDREGYRLTQGAESLERRLPLTASNLDVVKVLWAGKQVDAVRNEYVFRMPQTNARTAASVLDYQHRTPAVPRGWSLQSIGSGFFRLTAPNAAANTLMTWARNNGVQSLNVNAVRKMALTPNDPLYTDTDNWAFPQISASDAWDTGTGTSTTIVAVIDSGIDYNHPDLAANMWQNPNEIPGDGRDNDNNGYIDDVFGINAITGSGDPMDDNGHGTFCAGLIGAVGNNSVGMAGVNWNVQQMAVKIFDANGNTSIAAEIRGIQYVLGQKVAGQNIVAANLSYGGYQFIQQEFDALNQLAQTGVVIVAAAGNESNNNDAQPAFPASYVIPGLISVAASTRTDALAGFSNFGATSVDLAAPGVAVLSTRAARASLLAYPPHRGNTNYSVSSGTSFSAPLVAGTAALLKSLRPASSAEQVKAAILGGVDRVAGLTGRVLTGGRLNCEAAVNLILSTQGPTPVASFTTGQNLTFLEGSQGFTSAEIRVSLDRPADPGRAVSVWYETRPGGSALQDVDFVSQSGFLTFSGTETQKSFRINIVGDRLPESDERFAIRLDAARSRGVTIGDAQANVIILDDDNRSDPVQPGPTNPGGLPLLSIDVKREPDPANPGQSRAVPIREGGMATFVVSLDRTSDKTVTVKYRTNHPTLVPAGTALPGLDYTAVNGGLTFRPGERTKEFTVPVLADTLAEGDETFRVVLQEPVNAEFAGGAGGAGAGAAVTATIINVVPVVPPAPGFQVTINYVGAVSDQIRTATEWAAAKWSRVIVGDLPSEVDPQTGAVIDDFMIDVRLGLPGGTASDGLGLAVASGRPTQFRTGGTGLPWRGEISIDAADSGNAQLRDIVARELGLALGFVPELFVAKRLVNATGTGFIGANALREYRSVFVQRTATSVPLETAAVPGAVGRFWSEAFFRTELMTSDLNPGGSLPLSRVTVGAFQDLGYRVDYAGADSYSRPTSQLAVAMAPGAASGPAVNSLATSGPSPVVRAAEQAASPRPVATVGRLDAPGQRSFAALAVAGNEPVAVSATPIHRSGVNTTLWRGIWS